MKYLSVCSGIEAATVAWHPLGWTPVGFSEIDPFPSAVLQHHYPDVPNLGDLNAYQEWPELEFDLLVGGTPCQSFSVAGLRKGLRDPRGNLALAYVEVAARYKPRIVVWENVPGVLSSHKGRDFGAIVGALVELGYGVAWRVLDAQFFNVPQRRKRVFLVGYLRKYRRAAEILSLIEGSAGDSAPCRKAQQNAARRITGGAGSGSPRDLNPPVMAPLEAQDGPRWGSNQWVDRHKAVICEAPDTANPLTARMYKGINTTVDEGQTPVVVHATQDPLTSDIAFPLQAKNAGRLNAVAIAENQRAEVREMEVTGAVNQPGGKPGQGYQAVRIDTAVRRLTPRECERLQGFPDDYTLIPKASDTARYKALGNSMAVPVMRWIGQNIDKVEGRA